MQKAKKNKPPKSVRKKKKSKALVVFALFVLLALCLGAFLGARLVYLSITREAGLGSVASPTPQASEDSTFNFPNDADLSDNFSVAFGTPSVIGTQSAIICAEIQGEKNAANTYGFLIRDTSHNSGLEITADTSGNLIYAKTNQLIADTDYLVVAYMIEEGHLFYAKDMLEISTPEQLLSISQVETLLANEFPEETEDLSTEKKQAYETDACLKLLGFDVGDFGEYDMETKSAILLLEYSFSSSMHVCDFSHLSGVFTESLLDTLKDILSVTPIINKKVVLKPFTISSYSLTEYAKYAENGAYIDYDQMVLDALRQDETASATFSEYPFIVDSAEFQEKYASLINQEISDDEIQSLIGQYGRDTFNIPLETTLDAIAAKNKVYFASLESDWLSDLSGQLESTFTLTGAENTQTAFTLLLPAALAFCYMNNDYQTRTNSGMPVTVALRNTPKTWSSYSKGYGENEVLNFSAMWHLSRQQTESVPGFCLAEYLVSVDFAPADDTILSTDVYNYLYLHAQEFGFYPDTTKPFRWIYLGKSVSDETLAVSLPAEPLEIK